MCLEFEKKFIDNFAKDIDEKFINEKVYENGFVWHIFSYDKKDKSK